MRRRQNLVLEVPQPQRKKVVTTEYLTNILKEQRKQTRESDYNRQLNEHLQKYATPQQKGAPVPMQQQIWRYKQQQQQEQLCENEQQYRRQKQQQQKENTLMRINKKRRIQDEFKRQFIFPIPESIRQTIIEEPKMDYVKERANQIIEGERKAMEVGPTFVNYFYKNFDDMNMRSRMMLIEQLYCTQTCTTYNGKLGRHKEEARNIAMSIPIIERRRVEHIDAQPYLTTNAAVMIMVTGKINTTESEKERTFIEQFILMPFGENKYYIQNHQLRIK